MISRRTAMQAGLFLAGGLVAQACHVSTAEESNSDLTNIMQGPWLMPDEAAQHKRTWMAFGASERIWGRRLLPEVRQNLGTIAKTIARFEPVTMLVREREYDLAREYVGDTVELIVAPLDDLWIRDTGPVFVCDQQGHKAAIDFNFNGWGNKQTHRQDAQIAAFVAEQAGADVIHTDLVLEGGSIEVDGTGNAVITESCVLIDNRNPGVTKAQFEEKLMPLLGLQKIIWLPGIRGRDITDGHTDFYARFATPGQVLAGYDPDPASFDHEVTKRHLELLQGATTATGSNLEVQQLTAPSTIREAYANSDFAAGYIGFYVCNGAVIMQEFGDPQADQDAKDILEQTFPDREVVQINIDGIAAGGGSIHCATQQEPLAPR